MLDRAKIYSSFAGSRARVWYAWMCPRKHPNYFHVLLSSPASTLAQLEKYFRRGPVGDLHWRGGFPSLPSPGTIPRVQFHGRGVWPLKPSPGYTSILYHTSMDRPCAGVSLEMWVDLRRPLVDQQKTFIATPDSTSKIHRTLPSFTFLNIEWSNMKENCIYWQSQGISTHLWQFFLACPK